MIKSKELNFPFLIYLDTHTLKWYNIIINYTTQSRIKIGDGRANKLQQKVIRYNKQFCAYNLRHASNSV